MLPGSVFQVGICGFRGCFGRMPVGEDSRHEFKAKFVPGIPAVSAGVIVRRFGRVCGVWCAVGGCLRHGGFAGIAGTNLSGGRNRVDSGTAEWIGCCDRCVDGYSAMRIERATRRAHAGTCVFTCGAKRLVSSRNCGCRAPLCAHDCRFDEVTCVGYGAFWGMQRMWARRSSVVLSSWMSFENCWGTWIVLGATNESEERVFAWGGSRILERIGILRNFLRAKFAERLSRVARSRSSHASRASPGRRHNRNTRAEHTRRYAHDTSHVPSERGSSSSYSI